METNIIFLSYLARSFIGWGMFQTDLYRKSKHILCSITFLPENRATCEIMWKNIVDPNRPQMKIWHTRIAYWIPKATNTHSEYVILIAFPLQQWLCERASILCNTHIASPVHDLYTSPNKDTFQISLFHHAFQFHCFTVHFNSLYIMVQLMHLFVIKH
jgi:hypothetical protein